MKWLWLCIMVVFPTTVLAQTPIPQQMNASVAVVDATKKITFRISWAQSQQVDSTMIAVYLSRDTIPTVFRRTKSPDTVSFSIPDDTTTYKFMLVNLRRGLASLPANANFYFNANQYYRITRLHVRPKDVTVETGAQVQFCAFLEYNDGSIVMRDKDKTIPTCITEYEKFDSSLRKSLGARLRNANTVCLQWSTSAGTIENETCSK